MFQAQHAYKPKREDLDTDIDLKSGDILTNVEYLDNGWSIGFNVSTKQAGIFPRRNILPIQDGTSSIFPPPTPKSRPVYTHDRVDEFVASDEIVNWWKVIDTQALRQAYYQVVYTERSQFKLLKGVVGFVAGCILGALAFIGLRFALEYPLEVAGGLAAIITLLLIVGLAFSTKCRAVVCLCIPTLSTKSGRLMFSTFAMSILLAGPVTNINNNVTELASVSSCVGELLSNETAYIAKLALQPYDELYQGLLLTVEQLKNSAYVLTSFIEPIKDITSELSRIQARITSELTKAADECRSELDKAFGTCKTTMAKAAEDCAEFVDEAAESFSCGTGSVANRLNCDAGGNPQAREVCFQVVDDSICQPVDAVGGVCDTIESSFDFLDLSSQLKALSEGLSTNITLKDTIEGEVSTNASAGGAVKWLKEELEDRTSLIKEILKYVNWILSLATFLVVIQSYSYLRKYLREDRHDNNYITEGFVTVDTKRCRKGKWALLPLTPKERKQIADKRSWRLSGIEKKTFCTGFLAVFLTIISGAAIVAFDYFLYEMITLTNQYQGVTIDINEKVDVGIEVADGGLLSTFLQRLVGNIQVSSTIDHSIDFGVCAANATEPNLFHIIGLGVLYLFLGLTVLVHAYTLRLRHSMAGYFYPEREKDRIRYLHRKLLRRRVIIVKELKDVLMVKRQDNENITAVKDIVDDFKSLFCKGKPDDHEECYICEELLFINDLNWCHDCNSYFCNDCFNITLNGKCPCNPEENLTYDHVTDSDFEDDIQEQIVSQYYAYIDSNHIGDSNDTIPEEDMQMTAVHQPGDRQNPRAFFRQNTRNRTSWLYAGRQDH
ncbi:DC-STAMP domain-containing protein 2-like [Watersipora subatra]|uniref:DC-STAMP domain-containing protein 2-like n=1 Tax=Watersipora subatra TaxID=2589382 RepID=UPI00355B58B7